MVDIMEILIWLVCAWICYALAKDKNRNEVGWLFGGILFGIFAVIVIALLPKLEK